MKKLTLVAALFLVIIACKEHNHSHESEHKEEHHKNYEKY